MKNDMKIILGAIIVILLLLVGAYALSGSNNAQPTATPTVTPVTATPTPVPGGSSPTLVPTVAPTVAPTVTPEPMVTPTPVPESGVKLTEFGYWITYPPLGPQNWSMNPRPYVPSTPSDNIVYFDPTSDSITVDYRWLNDVVPEYDSAAVVHRTGDLSGTVNVKVRIESDTIGDSAFYGYYNLQNVVYLGDEVYQVTFEPGVADYTIGIQIYHAYPAGYDSINAQQQAPLEGSLKLVIIDADSGFLIGDDDEFTLDVTFVEVPVQSDSILE